MDACLFVGQQQSKCICIVWRRESKRTMTSVGKGRESDDAPAHSMGLKIMNRTAISPERKAEKILHVFKTANGTTMFLIKFKDSPLVEQVPAIEANISISQMVIDFYMDRLSFPPPDCRRSNPRKRKASEDDL
ncbi:heterochromatin protein 1 [Drosophila mauritiana]|uniref:Heterochromatin protein 1 n=1 Tax=Drosophila mauritiana TaxID=7226 RepID=A0A6P8JWD0_DROMA|nr:heterochromatin protein 1 [Drosophila mauritiana]